jgi:hypothetical protein
MDDAHQVIQKNQNEQIFENRRFTKMFIGDLCIIQI